MSNLRIAAEQALKSLGDAITVWTEEMEFRSSIDAADKWLESYAALREALAEPEQEPVGEVVIQDTRYHGYAMAIKPHIQGALPEGTNLYTYPPLLPAKPVGWLRVIDEAMVVHDCGVADPSDDYETAKRKLNTLLCIAQDIGSYFASQQHPPQRKPLTDQQKLDLVTNWFAEDWAINKALGLLHDYDIKQAQGIGGKE